ncbi:MAG: citrate synthase [Planctomycetes bacterium]|nr:citrate synthase [Planctomycetota bacterium]
MSASQPVAPSDASKAPKAGLEDIVVGTSKICFIDGKRGRLVYRGYNIDDLVNVSFEETIHLLLFGELPTRPELTRLKERLLAERRLPREVTAALMAMPHTGSPMAELRTAVSLLALHDPEANDSTPDANSRKAVRLIAQLPLLVGCINSLRQKQDLIQPSTSLGHAGNFLYLLSGKAPDERIEKMFDVALTLHADHEYNASTFAARVTAATLSDMYSAVTSAIGALKGPLHGGANEEVMRMLLDIGSIDSVDSYIKDCFAHKKKIPGFGHRVYKTMDPRATILKEFSRELGTREKESKWFEMSTRIQDLVVKEKNLYPNVDFYSASLYYVMRIPIEMFTPIFAVSRVVGWSAHILEQYSNNRLIRPMSEYIGPMDKAYVPIEKRTNTSNI